MIADAVAVVIGTAAAFGVQAVFRPVDQQIMLEHLGLIAACAPALVFGAMWTQLYRSRANERQADEFSNVVRTVLIGISAILLAAFVAKYDDLSRLWVAALGVALVLALTVERRIARRVFSKLRQEGRLQRRIVIVGTDPHAIALMQMYQRRPELGYEVVGFVGDDASVAGSGVPVLGEIDDIVGALEGVGAVGVILSLPSMSTDQVNSITRRLTDGRYHVALSSLLRDIAVTRLRPQQLDGQTLIYVEQVIRTGWRAALKRVFDTVFAAVVLVLSLPVLVVAALAIKLDSPGPVFFKQIRVGRNGEDFQLLKLRTMTTDAEERKRDLLDDNEADGPLFKIVNDPRITRVGRVLRKYSIDEIPQLVCVLRGSMSMVGPRPALRDEVVQWDDETHERLRVLPGLTGLWQVSGRSDSSFDSYKRMDLYYVDNWSIAHDLMICFKTVGVVLSGKGAA